MMVLIARQILVYFAFGITIGRPPRNFLLTRNKNHFDLWVTGHRMPKSIGVA